MQEPAAATERWLPELADLDLRPTAELLGLFIDGELAALRVVRQRLDQLIPAVDALGERFAAGGRVVYAGAEHRGGWACSMPPNAGQPSAWSREGSPPW